MPKRAANFNTSNARKRGRPGKKKDGGGDNGEENDEDILHQMRRRAIIDAGDEEEEWVRDLEREEGGHLIEDIYIPPKISKTEHPFTGQRLVIEKIVCENFKSYGGLKEMGIFHKSFSAIIGPNGNGKSNIIDAMLFVFGYRASKIRCKKVSTLIHNSELLPDLRCCAVTVHFVKIIDEGDKDGTDDYNIVPGSQIAVKRRAFADNSSKYYLNGKNVKFQEIAKFLKSNGVDLTHNRFLILQGEVEQIAQMPPIGSNGNDGLLEFLEEVIGTKRYIRPLAQLEERVEKLDYERDEKLQRVDKAEKEKEALTEPVKKAKEYLRDQNAKIRYENILLQKQVYQAKLKVTEKEEAKHKLVEKIQTLQVRLNEILEINQQRRNEMKEAENSFKVAEREYNKIKKKFDAADAEFIQLGQELQRSNETRKKLQKEKTKLEEEIEKLTGIPDSHKRDIDELQKQKLELETKIEKEEAACAADLERLNIKVEEALRMKEVTDRQFAEQKALRDDKKATIDKLEKQLANYKERVVTEKKKLDDLKAELDALKTSITQKQREGRTSLGTGEITALQEKAKKCAVKEGQLQAVENQKRGVFEAVRDEYQAAQEALDGNSQLDKVDRILLEAKADGTLPGLFGRLKNLAKIPEKYNIAATVSTGMLEYWVTDNDETGGKCIEFLRANDLPVQTFVCLTRLQTYAREAQQRFDTPAQSHRIFDLLEIQDPALRPAYYKAFRNTLVAENIDIATKVSYGGSRRHRVVTLKGELVEVTGSLVGGGRPINVGKFNSKKGAVTVTKQQLANLKQRHDVALKEFEEAQQARQNVAQSVRQTSQEIEDIKRKRINFESDMAALKAQIPLKETNLETQNKKLSELTLSEAALEEKEENLEEAKAEFEALLQPYEEAEENATRINAKVHDLQVTKKKEITLKLDKFKAQLKKVNEELNRKIVELKNCETNRKKAEKKLETIAKEIDNIQESMLKKNERKKAVEGEAKEIKEKETAAAVVVETRKQAFEELKGHSHEFQKEENTLTKEKVSLENKLADVNNELKGCQHFMRAHADTLDKQQVHDIPEEEVEPLKRFSDEEIRAYSTTELERKVKKYEEKIKSRPMPNLNILDEYRQKLEILLQRMKDLDLITVQRDKFREAYCMLEQQRSTEFMEGFALISSRLKEMFRMISMGGDAELEVVDSLDLFGCGINFSVRPARKTWKKISNLSGGEKTLSSLSLVFALHHFKPSPFYVMDEIDAALDFKNVSIIANYIKDRTKFTQFIIISLRSNMFELADSLLGVYKVDNMSYCIHFGVKKLVAELKQLYGKPTNGASQKQPLKENKDNEGQSQQQQQKEQPVAGSSKAMMEQHNRDKQRLQALNSQAAARFPAINVSAIIDEEVDNEENKSQNSPNSQISVAERTVIEADESPFTPPGRVSNTPNSKSAQKETESEDMFEDSQSFPSAGPIAASTPFVGKRTSTYDRSQGEQRQGGGAISDSDEDDNKVDVDESPEKDMEISPIKRVPPTVAPASPDVASDENEDASFKSAEDFDSDVDQIGPSASQ